MERLDWVLSLILTLIVGLMIGFVAGASTAVSEIIKEPTKPHIYCENYLLPETPLGGREVAVMILQLNFTDWQEQQAWQAYVDRHGVPAPVSGGRYNADYVFTSCEARGG